MPAETTLAAILLLKTSGPVVRHVVISLPVFPNCGGECPSPWVACAGATLTAPYNGYNYEQEAVVSDPGLFQMQVTGGPPGNGLDGTSPIRAMPNPPLFF